MAQQDKVVRIIATDPGGTTVLMCRLRLYGRPLPGYIDWRGCAFLPSESHDGIPTYRTRQGYRLYEEDIEHREGVPAEAGK
jgi:hypothetical protein